MTRDKNAAILVPRRLLPGRATNCARSNLRQEPPIVESELRQVEPVHVAVAVVIEGGFVFGLADHRAECLPEVAQVIPGNRPPTERETWFVIMTRGHEVAEQAVEPHVLRASGRRVAVGINLDAAAIAQLAAVDVQLVIAVDQR